MRDQLLDCIQIRSNSLTRQRRDMLGTCYRRSSSTSCTGLTSPLCTITLRLPTLPTPPLLASLAHCAPLHLTFRPFMHHHAWLHWSFKYHCTLPLEPSCITMPSSIGLLRATAPGSDPFTHHHTWPIGPLAFCDIVT